MLAVIRMRKGDRGKENKSIVAAIAWNPSTQEAGDHKFESACTLSPRPKKRRKTTTCDVLKAKW